MTVSWGANWPTLGLFAKFNGSTWTDISDYVRSIEVTHQASRNLARYGPRSLRVVLLNRDARFTPANTSGPYTSAGVSQIVADVPVRLEATWSGVTYNLFVGYAESWQDQFAAAGYDPTTSLVALDPSTNAASWRGTITAAEESSGVRVYRILDTIGVPIANRALMTGSETLQAGTMTGTAADMLSLVADSEGGAWWYDPLRSIDATDQFGGYVFEARSALVTNTRSSTSQATFSPTAVAYSDPQMVTTREQLLRAAAYTRVGGVEQVAGSGSPRDARSDLLNVTDNGVRAVAELAVALGSVANQYRVQSVTVQGIGSPAASWPHVLGRRLRDRVTVSLTPPTTGTTFTQQAFIDGVSHSISADMRWETTFQFQSATVWGTLNSSLWDTGLWDTAKWFF